MTTQVPFDPEAWRGLPLRTGDGLVFHLPMIDAALEYLDADRSVRVEVATAELAWAERVGLEDPPFYRWAIDAYRKPATLLLAGDDAARAAAWTAIEELGPGLAGAAFHGVIRSACAIVRNDPEDLARGLAFMRVSRRVLAGGGPASLATELVPAPDATALANHLISDQLDLLAGMPGICSPELLEGPVPPVLVMVADALSILHRDPGAFLTVHAVTSLHALIEFAALVSPADLRGRPGAGPMARWWRAWAIGAHLIRVALDISDPPPVEPTVAADFEAEVDAAVAGREGHDIKLAMALRRMVGFEVLTDRDAAVALAARTAASRTRG